MSLNNFDCRIDLKIVVTGDYPIRVLQRGYKRVLSPGEWEINQPEIVREFVEWVNETRQEMLGDLHSAETVDPVPAK